MQDHVDVAFDLEVMGDVVVLEPESAIPEGRSQVVHPAGQQRVEAHHLPAFRQQPIAQM